jgi:hypothetical protein
MVGCRNVGWLLAGWWYLLIAGIGVWTPSLPIRSGTRAQPQVEVPNCLYFQQQ